jgi:hypothetical protein
MPGMKITGSKKRAAPYVSCLAVALLLISCSSGPVQKTADQDQGFLQTYTQEAYTLEQRLDKKEITIAEQLALVLETSVPENTEVEFPRYSASLGDFTLKDTRILPVRMTGSGDSVRVVHQVTYLLEPYLSGTYTIPAMTVTYRDQGNDGIASRIVTEKIEVAVTSLLSQAADQAEIKDIKPPLALAPDRARFLAGGLVLLLLMLAAAGLLYWKKKSGKELPAALLPGPGEIALQELDRLLAEDLLSRGEIKSFHLRISDILRRYIENRFGLQAPERTTEEFLLELSRTRSRKNALLGRHKVLLADFLYQCDLVKFARHQPTRAESEKTVSICRKFIQKTREKGTSPGNPGP